MAIKDTLYFTNLLSFDNVKNVVRRYPYIDAGALTVAAAKVGQLVKFDALGTSVLGAVAADDAVLGGIIVDLPYPEDTPAPTKLKTVAVALTGDFDENQIDYSDGVQPISVTGKARLRTIGIYLDPAVPTGPFAP